MSLDAAFICTFLGEPCENVVLFNVVAIISPAHSLEMLLHVLCLLLASTTAALSAADVTTEDSTTGLTEQTHLLSSSCLHNLSRKQKSSISSELGNNNNRKYKSRHASVSCTPSSVLTFVQRNGWNSSEVAVSRSQKHSTTCDMYQGEYVNY